MPRFGMGARAPDDVEVRMRPQPLSFIPGSTRSVTAMTASTIDSKLVRHVPVSCPVTGVGGGPPVLLTRMSIGPSVRSTSAMLASITSSSLRSQMSGTALAPAASTWDTVAASASADRPAAATFTPSSPSRTAIAPPSPPLAPKTNAVRPAIPRSIVEQLLLV
jgi:hypothetical protein